MPTGFNSKKELDDKFPKMGIRAIKENYENIRNQFQTGDLLFLSGNHWLSSLIRMRSKAAWSHVGIVIRVDEIQRLFLAESIIEVGVRLIPLSFVVKDYDGHKNPYNGRVGWARYKDLTQEQALKITEFCLDNLSKQYDRAEYWRVLWRTIVGREKIFHDNKYSCAEYVYEAFKSAGIHLKYDRGDFISPGGIWRNERIEMKGMII
jgi:Permuted papain-like amidase enzyme, YaeF/YiiX, C92 family